MANAAGNDDIRKGERIPTITHTYLNFVYITDGVVELNRATLLEIRLGGIPVQSAERSTWSRCVSVARNRRQDRTRTTLCDRTSTLRMARAVSVQLASLIWRKIEQSSSILHWSAELGFRALDTGLNGLLPVPASLSGVRRVRTGWPLSGLRLQAPGWADGMDR